MKIFYIGLLVTLLIGAPICSAEGVNIGVFTHSETETCAAFGEFTPKSGDPVSLVSTDPTDTVVEAKIGVIAGSCTQLKKSLINGPYFKIEISKATEVPSVGFAILEAGKLSKENDVIVWRSEQLGVPTYLRSCASSEGLHLTAWDSSKIDKHAKWHQYVYLGYDLEPNCRESEVE